MKRSHPEPGTDGATKYLSRARLCSLLGISRASSYRLQQEGYLPQPVRLGRGLVRWLVVEVEAFERRLVEDRGRVHSRKVKP